MTYTIIDENEEQKKYSEVVEHITPQTLGLRPTTDFAEFAQQKIIDDNYEKAREWVNKGAIGVMEAGMNFADEFDGTYGNIDNNVHLTAAGNALKNTDYAPWQKKGQKVLGEIGNVLNKIYDGKAVYKEALRQAEIQDNQQKPHKNDPNYRYKPVAVDKTGRVIYDEVDLSKKIGFQEALAGSVLEGNALPFISGVVEGTSTKKYRNIAQRIRNNEEIRQDELDYVNRYLERKNEEYLRGYTFGGEIGKSWLPSMLAFGSEIMLGGAVLKGLGLAGKGIAGGVGVGKNLLKTGKVSKDIAKGVAYTSGQLMEGGINAAVTTAVNPARLFATYQERRLNDEMKITDRGTVIFQEAKETPAKAFMKSLGQVYISYFAENMGGLIGAPVRGLAGTGAKQFAKVLENNPLLAKFVKKSSPILAKAYEKLNNLPIKGKAVDWLKSQVKFDGFLEELGEEVLEDILNLTIGTDNEKRSLENYVKKIVKTPEEWAVLCGVIALQGTTLSLAGNMLGDIMQRNGTPEEKLFEVLLNSTENERLELLAGLVNRGDINIPDTALSSDLEIEKSEIEDRVFEKFAQIGEKEDVALANAKLFGQFFSKYGARNEKTKKKFYEWFNKFEVRYNVTPEELQEQLKQEANIDNVYDNFVSSHKKANLIEQAPEYWSGETIENAKEFLNFGNKSSIKIKSPIEEITINEGHLKHLIEDNNSYRKKYLNRVIRTIQNPNIILKDNDYHNYIKLFKSENDTIKPHLQIVKVKNDGSFYVTNYKPTKRQLKQLLQNEVVYDLVRNTDVENNSPANNSITDVDTNLNPSVKNNVLFQSAYHGTPHRFDEFSTEHIGSGEGAQAHGWGLYFAGNKEVSEGYRRTLTGDDFNNEQYYYDNNLIEDRNKKAILATIIENGKDKFIQVREKSLEKYKYSKEEYQQKSDELAWIKSLDENKIQKKTNNGQLFEVDIPELDVLLDENKTFSQQSEKVKKGILQIFKEKNPFSVVTEKIKWFDNMLNELEQKVIKDGGYTTQTNYAREIYEDKKAELENLLNKLNDYSKLKGKDIYKILSVVYEGDKEASLLLNKYGIKGIKYYGQEDGECYVIFDDKAVDVLKTYYQSANNNNQNVVDLTNDFDKTPTLQEVKEYINEIVEKGTKFATLSPEWFIDIKGSSKKKDHVAKSSNYSKMNKSQKNRHNKYVMSLEKLLANAEYLYPKENTKPDKKPNVVKYHYFKTDVKIGDKIYQVIFDTEEYKNEISSPSANVLRSVKNLDEDTNSITDNKENLNPKTVHLYNISEKKKVLHQEANEDEKLIAGFTQQEVMDKLTKLYKEIADTKDSELEKKLMVNINILNDVLVASENAIKFGNNDEKTDLYLKAYYVMNNQEIPKEYSEADSKRTLADIKKLHDERREKEALKYYGYFSETNDKNIITIMSNSNSSTALHELGHLFLNGLNELAKVDEGARKQLEAVNKWLGYSGEYTIAQQEKFALSFEAYLYRGKAPNNKLRQVFENFKEWLKAVYEHVSELVEKGADISDEVTEMFDKMFGADEYYQEKKEAAELLKKVKSLSKKEKVKKVSVRKDDELDETEKRHKEVSYDILSVATGKSKNYLKTIFETGSDKKGFSKKRENIETLLDSVEDRIKEQGGLLDEWKEFYSDYDNKDANADYKLAQQALNTIINKSYRNSAKILDEELTQRAEYFEQAIDEADRQYKLLLVSFKKGNRNVALSAMYDWLEDLDSEIKKDYEDRLNFDIAMIERNENIDKFDKAKREILFKAMELENKYSINQNEKYQELVKEIMKRLNFLQPADKAKLTVNILDVPSLDFLMSSIDNILDIAKTMEDVNYRRKLERDIHKELQQTKNVKKNGRSVGKYNYKTNKIFEQLRELDRKTPEEANNLRLDAEKFSTAEDNGLSFSQKLYNKFLSYKAGGRTFANTELMKSLYDDIVKIKLIGKSAKSEIELQEKLSEEKDIDDLINIVNNKKEASLALKAYVNGIGNLESTLNAIFNKKIANKYGAELLYAETNAQAFQYEQKTKFEKAVAKIYNLPEWCWDKKILDYLSEKHTYNEIRRKYNAKGELIKTRNIPRTLSKMDIISVYIYSKNEILEKRLKNQFGETTLEAMFDELSLEDVKLAELLMKTAQSFYPIVNKAFVKKYGLDLPKVSCYFPSTPERGSEVDLYNDYSSKSLGNGFTKARAQSELLPMDFHNPVTTLYSHIDGVAKFAFMSEHLDNINLRFKNTDLRRVIINKYGDDTYKTLEQILMNVTYKKEAQVYSGFNKVVDHLVTNWVSTNVAIKPIVGLKQLLSANNYAVDMPYLEWQAGFLKGLAHPKETIDYMMKIPYLKARFGGSMTNEFLKQTVENSAFAASKKLKDLCGLFIKTGDVGAIVFGGKPYVDYLIKQGMSEEEAIKQFVLSTNRTQQSSAVSSLSNLQVNWGRNPFLKLFIAYKNSPLQYIRMCGDALVAVSNGEMTKQQCAKTIFQYAYVQPFLYAVATSGSLFRFLFTGDDDDLIKDLTSSIFNLNADGIPFLGDIYKYAMDKIVYKERGMVQTTPLIGDIEKEIAELAKDDLDAGDYLKSIAYLLIQLGLGYNTNALATMGSGVGDVFTGEAAQGALKMFGYTDYRAKHITGKK